MKNGRRRRFVHSTVAHRLPDSDFLSELRAGTSAIVPGVGTDTRRRHKMRPVLSNSLRRCRLPPTWQARQAGEQADEGVPAGTWLLGRESHVFETRLGYAGPDHSGPGWAGGVLLG